MKYFLLPYVLLAALYGSVGYFSPGYDDEFFNIGLIERFRGDLPALVAAIERMDVHPPGSYLIDAILFRLLGDWALVRLAISLFTAGALVFAIESARRREGNRAALLWFGLLGLNPALLLWCTGLRWYAFFVPVLIWLTTVPARETRTYWLRCFGGLLVLGYLGYAAMVVALPVLVLYWAGAAGHWRDKLRALRAYAAVAALLYLPQAYFFLTVHIHHKNGQVSSLAKGLLGFAAAQVANQGVFPLSLPGLIAAVGTLGLVAMLAVAEGRRPFSNRHFLAYASAIAIMLLTGLASKMRNFVVVAVFQARWLASGSGGPKIRGGFWLFAGLILVANVWGVVNVASHRDTTKANWNLPVGEVLDRLGEIRSDCNGDLLVLAHDPMLSWHLADRGFALVVPSYRRLAPEFQANERHACLAFVQTYAGMIGRQHYVQLTGEVESLRYGTSRRVLLGFDSYAGWKRKIDPLYPDHGVEIVVLGNVSGLDVLRHWGRYRAAAAMPAPTGDGE